MATSQTMRCDILIVGAGPAGSCAARAAARMGADVIFIDKRTTVGVPVCCGEYIPAPLSKKLEIPEECIVQKTTAIHSFLHGRCIQELPAWGRIIARDVFDQSLARSAEVAGARLFTGMSFIGPESPDDMRRYVVVDNDGAKHIVETQILIGADGPRSRVASLVDSDEHEIVPGMLVRCKLKHPTEHVQIYFDESMPAGFGWVYPRGDMASVGLTMVKKTGCKSVNMMLQEFVKMLVEREVVEKPERLEPMGGIIPVEQRQCVFGHILLAGDAAGHAHPVTKQGMLQATAAGEMAGRWAAQAISSGNIDAVREYAEEWEDTCAGVLTHAGRRSKAWLDHEGSLEEIIRTFWVGFNEYYRP